MNASDSIVSRQWLVGLCGAIALIASNYTFAIDQSSAHRYQLTGSGTLALDAPAQGNGTLRLKAQLTPSAVAVEQPATQFGGQYSLTAALASSSLVCYSDTIFRDDFDGDGF